MHKYCIEENIMLPCIFTFENLRLSNAKRILCNEHVDIRILDLNNMIPVFYLWSIHRDSRRVQPSDLEK